MKKKVVSKPSKADKNLFLYLAADDHRAFKVAAARAGTTMSEITRALVLDWLKNRREPANAA